MGRSSDATRASGAPRGTTDRRPGIRPDPSRRPDAAWDRFVARYGPFIRGYGSAIGAEASELEGLVVRVVAEFLSVRPTFDRESVRAGARAIDHLGRAVRIVLAEMRAGRAGLGARRTRRGVGPNPSGHGARDEGLVKDPRGLEVWRRIALSLARREVAATSPQEHLLAYDLAVRDGLRDPEVARLLALEPVEVRRRRAKVGAALEAAYRRLLENPDPGEAAADDERAGAG